MAYRPIPLKSGFNPTSAVATMPVKGLELTTAPQFLDVNYALDINNYEIEGLAKLIKRKGITKILQVAGTSPITLLKEFTTDVWVFGYATTIATYTISTNTVTTRKNTFSAGTLDGGRYGDYFFMCNGTDKIWRMDNSTYTPAEVAASPAGTVGLTFIGPRCFAWYNDTVQYSEVDTGSNPPFTAWTNSTTATAGGKVNYRNAGDVRSVVPLGESVVVFSDKGFFAFNIVVDNVGGTNLKYENVVNYTEDYGGARGAIVTEKGIFYNNEQGLWNLVSIGQLNQPFSRQTSIISTNLGDNYFENVDFSNGDIAYDPVKSTVYITCARGSATNNLIICAKMLSKGVAFSTITNWNISRFMNINGVLYGASDANTTVYRLFDGYTDDGQIIGTKYRQEIKLGDLETKQMLKGCYTQGFLSPSSLIKVRFDAYSETGILTRDKLKYNWTAQYSAVSMDSYNSAKYGSSSYNGDVGTAGLVESFDGCRPFIRNLQRLRINITSTDKYPHQLTWIKLEARVKGKIRRRKLELTT